MKSLQWGIALSCTLGLFGCAHAPGQQTMPGIEASADLVPSLTDGDGCAPGTAARVTVTNQGKVACGPFTTEITTPNGSVFHTLMGPLGVGASEGMGELRLIGCIPGHCGFHVEVDTKHQIHESDETNNSLNGECGEFADLVPTPTNGDDYCAPGGPAGRELLITVKNQGTLGSPLCMAVIRIPLNGSTVGVLIPAIPAGGSVDLPAVPLTGCRAGNCGFTITVDANRIVAESNENNNVAKGGCGA